MVRIVEYSHIALYSRVLKVIQIVIKRTPLNVRLKVNVYDEMLDLQVSFCIFFLVLDIKYCNVSYLEWFR